MDIQTIINRVKNMILTPKVEWVAIKTENKTKQQTITSFLIPVLVALAAGALIGAALFPDFRFSFGYSIAKAIEAFVVPLAAIFITAIAMNGIAPHFEAPKNVDLYFNILAYGSTALFVASLVVGVLPMLYFLSLFGLYSGYLIWLGIESNIQLPEDKKLGFAAVSILIYMIAYGVIQLIVAAITSSIFYAHVFNSFIR